MENISLEESTILIVDDTPENISVLSGTLELHGYKILVALNGKSGIDRAKYGQPDLILLDVMMEGLDGFETCELLQKDRETMDIPVIFMTALSGISDKVKGFKSGAVDYITKPFQAEEVLARVKTHITISKLQKKLERYNEQLEYKVKERTLELEIAKDKAEAASKVKSEFLAQISHEIRTPLNGILGSLSFLEDKYLENSDLETKQDILTVRNSSMRLLRTIDLLINVSQLQAGSKELYSEKVDLVKMCVIPILEAYEGQALQKQLKITFENNAEKTYIESDEESITQIIENLVDNAINYTNEGFINIKTYNDSNGKIIFEIEDSGIGMSPEFIDEMYDAFSQEDKGLTRTYEGNGLGLSLVKLLSKKLNISISVDSKKNVGTTFRVIFNTI